MNKLQLQIHEFLKSKYEKAAGKTMVCQKNILLAKNKYYFENLNDNFFEPMSDETKAFFESAKGTGLDKMRALRSSAAMIYNIFGNGPVSIKENEIIGAGEYKLEYEKYLETLKDAEDFTVPGAFLEKDGELCFFDVKLFEPFYHKTNILKGLSADYGDMDSYIYTDSAYSFNESIDKLNLSDIKRYDVCQMFKHTLGIYNYARKNELKGKKITLVNCIWTMNEDLKDEKLNFQCKQIEEEEKSEFKKFEECMFNAKNAFSKLKVDFSVKLISIKELIDILNLSDERRNWLSRYL